MTKPQQTARSFASPSPGELLKRQAIGRQAIDRKNEQTTNDTAPPNRSANLACDPFTPSPFVEALQARGVMLAPLLVQWNYKVSATLPFTKWLKTKEVLLSDARMQVNDDTAGIHYFGTYVLQGALRADPIAAPDASPAAARSAAAPVPCQTLWGYSSEAAMLHMFDLCRGKIDRVSIVQNDLRDFVNGLKGHVSQVGTVHFSQTVLMAPAAM